MNMNFELLNKFDNKKGRYTPWLSTYLIDNQFVSNHVEYYTNSDAVSLYYEKLIYQLIIRNISFKCYEDFEKYYKYAHMQNKPLIALLLIDINFFDVKMLKKTGSMIFPVTYSTSITYLMRKELYEKIKPFIKMNHKVFDTKELNNNELLILNTDIVKGIPIVKFGYFVKTALFSLDYDNWKNILFTGNTLKHIKDNDRYYKNSNILYYLRCLTIFNERCIIPDYERAITQIVKNYISPYDLSILYTFNDRTLSKILFEVFGENTLIQCANKFNYHKPLTTDNLNYGPHFFENIDLNNLKFIQRASPTLMLYMLRRYPNVLLKLNKNNFRKFNTKNIIRLVEIIMDYSNKEVPNLKIDVLKKLLTLFENRKFENDVYKEFPKLKMLLID